MTTLDNIIALASAEIERVTNRYAEAGDWKAWEDGMRKAIATGHSAATWASVGERGFGGRVRQWIGGLLGNRILPKDDKQRLEAIMQEQLGYLKRFAAEAAGLSKAAIAARAQLYAGAIRSTYYETRWGDWIIPPSLLPGNQECLGNCRCTIDIRDNGDGTGVLTRVMGGENHCTECPPLAGDHPVRRARA